MQPDTANVGFDHQSTEFANRDETVGIAYGMYAMPATFTPGERWFS